VLILLILNFSFILISAANFALLLLALEGFSLILYIMTTLDRSQGGVTAAVKYFTFGTLGSILLFLGITQIYLTVPSLSYKVIFFALDFNYLIPFNNQILSSLEFSLTLVLIGFLVKLGAAPLHY